MTNSELLTQIDTAITAILSGAQSYTALGRSLTRANLAELRAWRKEIYPLVQQENAGESGKVKVGYAFPEY
jgi:hypothetical protein